MEQLGIQPSLLLAQIINFSIIVIVLTKLLYKPILEALEKRRKEIEKGVTLTQKMQEEEEKLQQKKKRLIEEARGESLTIIEDARIQAKEVEKEVIAQAHRDAREVMNRAKADTDKLRLALEKDIRRQTVEFASLMAKRIISQALSPEDKHKIIEKHLRELVSKQEEAS